MSETTKLNYSNAVTLGLDLGPSSIGWALIDEQKEEVIASGVRVFPEGVDRDARGGEKSKSQTRREKRMIRRQIQRRSRRLRILKQALAEMELLPASAVEQNIILDVNPYKLRMRALSERLELYEIGRIFYHLAKRRGFLSNRKTDRGKESETRGMLAEIAELDTEIHDAQCQTLGEYLASIEAEGGKVRGRHTRRDMYLSEFDAIWEAQRQFHPAILTESNKYGSKGLQVYPEDPDNRRKRGSESHLQRYGIHGIMFFQRRVYWPASIIGRCELEPSQKRCPKADRLAQRFRILQEVNNLRYRDPFSGTEQKLTDEQRNELIDYLSTGKERTFENIRKRLVKKGLPAGARFNFERAERDKLKGHLTDTALASNKCLGKDWYQFEESQKNEIVRILTEPHLSDIEAIQELQDKGNLSLADAELAFKAKLPDGHANLSRAAIKKLLPYLERGFSLLGNDETDSALHAAGYFKPPALGERHILGPVPNSITNPIVRQALHETRKVVNAILREYGTPGQIRIELARQAKKSFVERKEILYENVKRAKEREVAAERLQEIGIELPKRRDTQRYLLWEEADHICVYCGKPISSAQLVSGEANVDHILPRWRSLDDSYMNKVLCHRGCNEDKGDKTPREWLEDADPQRYEEVLVRARKLPYAKQGRFTRENLELDEFVNRHLTDTTYISRQVRDYMQTLGISVSSSRGTITAELRRFWGLNTILFPEGEGQKTRADHRHHAVDAAVVALATPKRLHYLAQVRGRERERQVDPPWPGLREDLSASIAAVNVSHKPRRRISGSLHEETFFGPTQKVAEENRKPIDKRPWAKEWQEGEDIFVRRKPVSEIKKGKHLAAVRDRAIRECLADHLRARGVDPEGKKDYPKGIFEGDNLPKMASGMPIRKVRLIEHLTTAQPASETRRYQFVQPGSNHHICYYEIVDKKGKPKWQARVTTMWDAALRVRRDGHSPVDSSDCELGRFVMSLSIGECFTVNDENRHEQLCIVRKIDGTGRMHYRLHTDARKAGDLTKENLYFSPENLRTLQARKVTLDPLGCFRRSGD